MNYRDEAWLREKYWDEGLSLPQIGELSNCVSSTVLRWMKEYNIPRRSIADGIRKSLNVYAGAEYANAEWLRRKYCDEELSTPQIGALVGKSDGAILRWMRIYGITRRRGGNGKGPKHPRWKGGRSKTAQGYIMRTRTSFTDEEQAILAPMFIKAARNQVLEHRAVAALALGRPLKKDEFPHHLNLVRDDNRLENLQLVNHHKEPICPDCGGPMGNLQEYLDQGNA